jgi:aldehyde dehydrogenase (NAD+)
MIEWDKFYIGGEWVDPVSGNVIEVISPHSEKVVGVVPDAGPADVDGAIAAARTAMAGDWGHSTPHERAAVLAHLATEYAKRAEDVATAQVLEMGCPISQVREVMVDPSIAALEYYSEIASTYEQEERRESRRGIVSVVRRKPIGVVGAIVPWNGPNYLSMLKIGPAMVAGCATVLKPAPEAPLDLYVLAEAAIVAGVPPGVLNIVAGGRETGEYLVLHDDVDKVAFTGSGAAGRRVAELSGGRLRPVTLELGGKSAAIVLEDADLDKTLAGLAVNCFINSGQVCSLDSRVLVHRSRVVEFTEAFVAMASSLKVGDPLDPETQIGPLVAERQRDRVEGYIQAGLDAGARLLTGGGRPPDQPTGWYIQPTVFDQVHPDMKIVREEIFGPVISIFAYDTVDEAIALSNDSDYGLAGSIWTDDVEKALRISARVNTGTMAINGFGCQICAPFGGVKSSGLGREMGPESVQAYVELQSVLLPHA